MPRCLERLAWPAQMPHVYTDFVLMITFNAASERQQRLSWRHVVFLGRTITVYFRWYCASLILSYGVKCFATLYWYFYFCFDAADCRFCRRLDFGHYFLHLPFLPLSWFSTQRYHTSRWVRHIRSIAIFAVMIDGAISLGRFDGRPLNFGYMGTCCYSDWAC